MQTALFLRQQPLSEAPGRHLWTNFTPAPDYVQIKKCVHCADMTGSETQWWL